MEQYNASGIKVLDRAVLILRTVAEKPLSLADLSAATGLPRASTHRIATALETHGLVRRDEHGHFTLGEWLHTSPTLTEKARPIMEKLVKESSESVQLYQLRDGARVCIASLAPEAGLQNIVPAGTVLPVRAGSAAQVFVAFGAIPLPADAAFGPAELASAKQRGWAESISEREAGLASVSAPVLDAHGNVIAVLSLSGLAERLVPSPGTAWGQAVKEAAEELSRS